MASLSNLDVSGRSQPVEGNCSLERWVSQQSGSRGQEVPGRQWPRLNHLVEPLLELGFWKIDGLILVKSAELIPQKHLKLECLDSRTLLYFICCCDYR